MVGVVIFFVMIKDVLKFEKVKFVNLLFLKIYDKNGDLVYEYGKEKRMNVMYE